MKNIHILPTDKPSRLIIYSIMLNEFRLLDELYDDWKHKRHIYVTNSEEIKEGDWYIVNGVLIHKKTQYIDTLATSKRDCKKIILTTDQDLIKDGVQAIDDEFIEWFVNNPSCEEIYVNKIESFDFEINKYVYNYKIIIPKEEPKKHKVIIVGNGIPKQEILEEAKLRQLFKNRSNCYADADADEVVQAMDEDCFISTINEWKQDQDKKLYSEGEVIGMLKLFVTMLKKNHTHTYTIDFEKSVKKWFEKFKKK